MSVARDSGKQHKKKLKLAPKVNHDVTTRVKPQSGPPTPEKAGPPTNRPLAHRNLLKDIDHATKAPAGRAIGTKQYIQRGGTVDRSATNEQLAAQLRLLRHPDAEVHKRQEASVAPLRPIGDAAKLLARPTLGVLELAARPSHAVAGYTDTAIQTHNPIRAFNEGIRGLEGRQHTGFADVLEHLGVHNGIAKHGGGFLADVLTDPLTYLTLGTASVARKGATAAVTGAAERKGLQVGFRAHIPTVRKGGRLGVRLGRKTIQGKTSGRLTAKLNDIPFVPGVKGGKPKVMSGHDVATAVRESRPAQSLGKNLAPDFKPKTVNPTVWKKGRQSDRHLRAKIHVGERNAHDTQEAYTKALSNPRRVAKVGKRKLVHDDVASERTVAAIERAPKNPPQGVHPVREKNPLHKDLASAKRRKQKADRKLLKERGREELRPKIQEALRLENSSLEHRAGVGRMIGRVKWAKNPEARPSDLTAAYRSKVHEDLMAKAVTNPQPALGTEAVAARLDLQAARKDFVDTQRSIEKLLKEPGPLDQAGVAILKGLRDQRKQAEKILWKATQHAVKVDRPVRLVRAEVEAQDAAAGLKLAEQSAKGQPKRITKLRTAQGEDYMADVRPGLEKVTPNDIPEGHIARAAEADLKAMRDREAAAGSPDTRRPDYAPHQRPEDVEHDVRKLVADTETIHGVPVVRSGSKFGHDAERKIEGSVREINQRVDEGVGETRFSTKLGDLMGHRHLKSEQRVAKMEYTRELASHGTEITPGKLPAIPPGESVFHRTPNGAIVPATKEQLNALANGNKLDGTFHLLNVENLQARLATFDRIVSSPGLYKKFMGAWKTGYTVVQPAYHIGNFIGDMVLAWEADAAIAVHFGEAVRATKLNARFQAFQRSADRAAGKTFESTLKSPEDIRLYLLVREAENHGALQTGFFGSEIKSLSGKQSGKLRRFNEHRENFPRLLTYMTARDEGMTADRAAEWVNKHHIDYGDLTPAEQKIREWGIPFYTFFARNTRVQATKLFERPGKAANFELAREDSADAAGEDKMFARVLATYQQAGAPFIVKVAGHNLLLYGRTPIETGLANISGNAPKQVLSRVGPQWKIPVELTLNYNSFMQRDISSAADKTDLLPAPSWALKLPPPLQAWLKVQKTPKGIFWSGTADYGVKQVPFAKPASDTFTGSEQKNRYGQTPAMSAVSALGVKVGPLPTKDQLSGFAETKEYLDITGRQKTLRRLGLDKVKVGDHMEYSPAMKALKLREAQLNALYLRRNAKGKAAPAAATPAPARRSIPPLP